MKTWAKISGSSLLMIIIFSMVACMSGRKKKWERLGPVDFSQSLKAVTNPQLIDARSHDDYLKGHINGAISINLFEYGFKNKIATLEKNEPVFIYCQSGIPGARSEQMAQYLVKKGFEKVFELEGGYDAWKESFPSSAGLHYKPR